MDLRTQILQARDILTRSVAVPEWGMAVHVRMLTGHDRHRLEQAWGEHHKEPMRLMAIMVCLATSDENGARVFQDGDEEAILGKNADAIERIFKAAAEFNQISNASREKLEGNSEGVSGNSSS